MKTTDVDIVIIGAGPVGLMSSYLAKLSGLSVLIVDKTEGPLQVGRADALNARTLQLLELAGIFEDVYHLGKPCNTSSIWSNGKFHSRQSSWWNEIQGCFHKHFLMLGQSFIEKNLDEKLRILGSDVLRGTHVTDLEVKSDHCITTLSNGNRVSSKYIIGADGSRSFVREHLKIPFEITRPQIIWAVIDGVIDTDFEKVPEIIVFQNETSDVAWIPREGNLDRFYIRMDKKEFSIEESLAKINQAISPHTLTFKEVTWFSQFSVKESVAEKFSYQNKVFLAGDSCHIHSVNGGQGLNTGLGDAFNLIWKIAMVENHGLSVSLLDTYESERKPVALSVIETSGELVRSTKYSENGTHAEDYVRIVQKRAGNITGMGIRYGKEGLVGERVFDFLVDDKRLYELLDYTKFNLVVFDELQIPATLPDYVKVIKASSQDKYPFKALLVRPDSYIGKVFQNENEFTEQMLLV